MTSDRSFNVAAPAIEAAAPGSKCAEVWNEMAVMHEESSRRRRLYYERRGGEKKGHGSHEDYRAAAAYPSFLWMQNSSSCIHDRERTNVFCVTETLWSQTQKPLCVTWASLYYSSLETFNSRKGSMRIFNKNYWKSLKTLQVATLFLASFI